MHPGALGAQDARVVHPDLDRAALGCRCGDGAMGVGVPDVLGHRPRGFADQRRGVLRCLGVHVRDQDRVATCDQQARDLAPHAAPGPGHHSHLHAREPSRAGQRWCASKCFPRRVRGPAQPVMAARKTTRSKPKPRRKPTRRKPVRRKPLSARVRSFSPARLRISEPRGLESRCTCPGAGRRRPAAGVRLLLRLGGREGRRGARHRAAVPARRRRLRHPRRADLLRPGRDRHH